ncbi:ATP-binding protein [Dactylosporangium sp. NPDC006015]|uniref:PAS domain-containing sensor histidine kinase n=1 Tax=Dactylosporangium sp. NPDC006015 TaxID=3154576 RepID=UPI0033B29FA5
MLFQHAPAALLVLDPQLTIVDASDAYLAATMRTRHGLIGRHVFEAFPVNPDDPDAPGVASLEASLRRVLREQTTDVMAIHQYDIPRVGGGFEKRFWAPVSVPVCDEDGRLRWIVHRVDDVTAYVESQPDGLRFAQLAEQLRSSNARAEAEVFAHQRLHEEHQVLQALLDSLDAAVVGCGHDDRVVLANDAARDLLGAQIAVPPTEWGPALHLHHPDGRPIAPEDLPLVRALRGERVRDAEIVRRTPGVPRRHFRVNGRAVLGQPGLAAVAAIHDVTAHRRAAALKECEILVGQAIRGPGPVDGILARVVELVGSKAEWAAAEFWTVDAVAHVLRRATHWVDRDHELPRPVRDPLACGEGIPGRAWQAAAPVHEGDLRAEDGWGSVKVALAVPIPSGSAVLGVLVCYSDLVEVPDDVRLAMVTGVGAHLGEFLERRRAVRLTAELDRTRDEYIALVGHELRTPLTTLHSYTELMLEDPGLADEHRQMLAVMQRNAGTLHTLVGRLLEVAGMRSGHIRHVPAPMDLAAVVRAAADSARTGITNAVTVDVNAPDAVPMDGDAERLRRVVDELLANALAWAADGSTVGVHVHGDERTTTLSVSNVGERIPAEDRPRLFDLFFRADSARHSGVPGTGLGLTLARAVVEQHGGAIAVSEPDEPATIFTVRLPTRQPVPPASSGS